MTRISENPTACCSPCLYAALFVSVLAISAPLPLKHLPHSSPHQHREHVFIVWSQGRLLIRPSPSPPCSVARAGGGPQRTHSGRSRILADHTSTNPLNDTTMPLFKLTAKRLARKEKEERIAAKAEDSDASSVSDMDSEDGNVLSDEDGESASGPSAANSRRRADVQTSSRLRTPQAWTADVVTTPGPLGHSAGSTPEASGCIARDWSSPTQKRADPRPFERQRRQRRRVGRRGL